MVKRGGFLGLKIKSNNKIIRYNFILIATITLSIIFTGCTKSEVLGEVSDYTRAIIEKNNNIYLYKSGGSYLDTIGDVEKLKELETLSSDNKYLAFKYLDDNSRIIIYEIENNNYIELPIDNSGDYQVMSIKWVGSNIAVSLFKDKNTTQTLIYDFKSGKVINTCEGIFIGAVDNGNLAVYGRVEDGKTKIYMGTREIYTIENDSEVLLSGAVNDDQEIAFLTFLYNRETGEQQEFVYRGKIEKEGLTNIKKIEKPYSISGDIVFDGDNMIIKTGYGIYGVTENGFKLLDSDKQAEVYKESEKNIRAIFKKTFISEDILESSSFKDMGIDKIIWFYK